MRREPEEENSSLGSPTYNYSAMLNREDIPQPPAREVFREPSEEQTYAGYGNGNGNTRFSTMTADVNGERLSDSGNAAAIGANAGVFTRGSLMDRNIEAVSEPAPGFLEKTQQSTKAATGYDCNCIHLKRVCSFSLALT